MTTLRIPVPLDYLYWLRETEFTMASAILAEMDLETGELSVLTYLDEKRPPLEDR